MIQQITASLHIKAHLDCQCQASPCQLMLKANQIKLFMRINLVPVDHMKPWKIIRVHLRLSLVNGRVMLLHLVMYQKLNVKVKDKDSQRLRGLSRQGVIIVLNMVHNDISREELNQPIVVINPVMAELSEVIIHTANTVSNGVNHHSKSLV